MDLEIARDAVKQVLKSMHVKAEVLTPRDDPSVLMVCELHERNGQSYGTHFSLDLIEVYQARLGLAVMIKHRRDAVLKELETLCSKPSKPAA